ncbi:hypothetical protein AMD27_17440 (plasmid) [Acinetobacter sp. TGL-Y2]|uniref:hypothetical protein n=1 Tax=Acinetobacter sp. TGL-Y2 TaxID=1407071 RepID=UPI0007A672C0|nr:hypothetical protein [Acinetobacter sp. TGL-Y2]AMW80700.1 hypothetical protein AMD27_17440 [Acinetobacter sp. TGL-Y2]
MAMPIIVWFYQDSQSLKQDIEKSSLQKVTAFLKANECYTAASNIQIFKPKDALEINYQCFKANTQLNLLTSIKQQDIMFGPYDINSRSVSTDHLDEKIQIISAPDQYKEQCERGEKKTYCDLLKQETRYLHQTF